ncbi:right-handed parallel beta-helix repeat-containing protein, partial [Candidatus Desantisbacteria bacterium]|nr:right-handed parallel beta-helix repeat-containing protein [Candidatus Desantisbacteria bacterium]
MNKTIYIYLFCLLFIFSGCRGGINSITKKSTLPVQKVSGRIITDTIWEGIIEVEDKIFIPDGLTLTIKPGTIIRFRKNNYKKSGHGDNRIYVQKNAKIIAAGEKFNNIFFTSAEAKPGSGDWQGLEFHPENSISIIKYCRIEYAEEAIICVISSPCISNNIITKNNKGICIWQMSMPLITENLITENNIGILCSSKSNPSITSNIIKNNKTCGISCEKGASGTINRNKILNNYTGIKSFLNNILKIEENIIKNNNFGIYQQSAKSGSISGNTIEENKYGIYSLRKTVLDIHNNKINKNEYGIFIWERTQGLISNNNFSNNKFGIYCGKSSHIDILNNNIIKNAIGVLCEFSSYPIINFNNIYDQTDYDIKLGENQS